MQRRLIRFPSSALHGTSKAPRSPLSLESVLSPRFLPITALIPLKRHGIGSKQGPSVRSRNGHVPYIRIGVYGDSLASQFHMKGDS
jgi:hypothetical protein